MKTQPFTVRLSPDEVKKLTARAAEVGEKPAVWAKSAITLSLSAQKSDNPEAIHHRLDCLQEAVLNLNDHITHTRQTLDLFIEALAQ